MARKLQTREEILELMDAVFASAKNDPVMAQIVLDQAQEKGIIRKKIKN